MDIDIDELKKNLEAIILRKISFSMDKDSEPVTFSFESEIFDLYFWVDEDIFIIGRFEVYVEQKGFASAIIESIIEFCEESGFSEVRAKKMKNSSSRNFWVSQEFYSDGDDCRFDL